MDLKSFCSTDPLYTYLSEPFSFGDFTYATNGHVMIRVARVEGVREGVGDGAKRLDVAGVERVLNMSRGPSFVPLSGVSFPIDETPLTDCAECGGNGHRGYDADDCEINCTACHGAGETGSSRSVSVFGIAFSIKYIEKILALPGAEISTQPVDRTPFCFRFDGGIGALMPLSFAFDRHLGDISAHVVAA